ncbi:MAG: hypothetical protein ACJ0F8_02465 [Gammaproteobacteria bacterium]|nr:hypothetical protein [SAR86 cluster bacterium]|tara:strand:+ start:821 stop:976 length:156 start_codon:yes stop_codon:yes gene_type:complete
MDELKNYFLSNKDDDYFLRKIAFQYFSNDMSAAKYFVSTLQDEENASSFTK